MNCVAKRAIRPRLAIFVASMRNDARLDHKRKPSLRSFGRSSHGISRKFVAPGQWKVRFKPIGGVARRRGSGLLVAGRTVDDNGEGGAAAAIRSGFQQPASRSICYRSVALFAPRPRFLGGQLRRTRYYPPPPPACVCACEGGVRCWQCSRTAASAPRTSPHDDGGVRRATCSKQRRRRRAANNSGATVVACCKRWRRRMHGLVSRYDNDLRILLYVNEFLSIVPPPKKLAIFRPTTYNTIPRLTTQSPYRIQP